MKIYVASSWRCPYQPEVVQKLRALGHEVYDFRGSGTGWGETKGTDGGFHWSEVDPEWQSWPSDIPRYLKGLQHPRAIEGYNRDMDALKLADACLLVESVRTERSCGAWMGSRSQEDDSSILSRDSRTRFDAENGRIGHRLVAQ